MIESSIFQLFGDQVIEGQYELALDFEHGYVLKERFPELIDASLQEDVYYDGWSSYQVSKVSPDIVGNIELEQAQCFHPQGNEVFEMPMPGATSDFKNGADSQEENAFRPRFPINS